MKLYIDSKWVVGRAPDWVFCLWTDGLFTWQGMPLDFSIEVTCTPNGCETKAFGCSSSHNYWSVSGIEGALSQIARIAYTFISRSKRTDKDVERCGSWGDAWQSTRQVRGVLFSSAVNGNVLNVRVWNSDEDTGEGFWITHFARLQDGDFVQLVRKKVNWSDSSVSFFLQWRRPRLSLQLGLADCVCFAGKS